MATVRILSSELEVEIKSGESLLKVLEFQKSNIKFRCRVGACGSCRIEIKENIQNLNSYTNAEVKYFSKFPGNSNHRLACQCKVFDDVSIEHY